MYNNKKTFTRSKLSHYIRIASGVSLMALGSVAQAQEADESTDQEAMEEIQVTGQRASILSAQDIKRDAEQVVDAISAVDIGALPDRSVSEALQRIPGVQLQRTNTNRDPARLSAEGGGVFVRGLSWVRTEMNGRDIFSASGGRTLGFEDVSADLLSGIDVYKNPTADQVEGGLGGTVNLRTRLPLEQDDRLLAFSGDYNYADLYGEGFTSGNGLYSDRFEIGGGEIGILISASIADIGNRTDAIQTGRYETQMEENGQEVLLPTSLGFRRVDWDQERNAYNGVFQWAPNDELTVTAQAFYAEANPVDVERAVAIEGPWNSPLAPWNGEYQYNDSNAVVSGVLNNTNIAFNNRYGSRDSHVADYSLGFEFSPSDRWSLSGDVQYVDSRAQILSMTAYTGILPGADGLYPSANFDFTGSAPTISVTDQNRLARKDQYWWGAAMDHLEDNEAKSLAGRIDAEYEFEDSSFLRSFRFGARATDKDTITRQTGWNWSLLSNQYWLNNNADNTAFLRDSAADQSELIAFDNFMRGDVNVPTAGWFPKEGLVSSNTGAYDYFESMVANNGQYWGWAPLTAPDSYDTSDARVDNVGAGINEQYEQTTAFYTSLRFGDDEGKLLGLPFDGNLGVRVVETETTSYGRPTAGMNDNECGWNPSEDCEIANAFVSDFMAKNHGGYQRFDTSYTNVLPSMNLRFMLQDDLQLRFGLSRGMVRPTFTQNRPYTFIELDFEGNQFDPFNKTHGTLAAGEPSLKPTVANQFDTSIEWYFDDSASVTFAAFYKDIQDYIALVTRSAQYTYGGETLDIEETRQINAESGKVQGFELAYQQFYDMLPSPFDGLGVQANYTYIDNSGGINTAINPIDTDQQAGVADEVLPIEGMSPTSYNLALMYEKYDVSARLAYNWRERYLLTTSAANLNRPVWFDDYGQLDGSLFYNATDNLKFGLQVTNILNSRTELQVQAENSTAPQYSWTDTDRRFAFVTRYSF